MASWTAANQESRKFILRNCPKRFRNTIITTPRRPLHIPPRELRTLGKPVGEPYEVQCFFVAKDKSQARYIYDAIRFHSSAQLDEVNVFARDLFGGTKTTDISVSNNPISGTTSRGDYFYGTLTSTVVLTSTKPGSQVEGWIVRVVSGGQVVRFDA